jgi:hypothetical protein
LHSGIATTKTNIDAMNNGIGHIADVQGYFWIARQGFSVCKASVTAPTDMADWPGGSRGQVALAGQILSPDK